MNRSLSFRHFASVLTLQEGISAHYAGNIDKAEHIFKKVLSIEPKNFMALHLSGVILMQRGQPEAAVRMLSKALDISSEEPAAWINLSAALCRAKRAAAAAVAATRTISMWPDFAVAYYHRGNANFDLGKYRDALADYESALKMDGTIIDEELRQRLLVLQKSALASV